MNRRAFTLVEALLAIALFVALAGAVFGFVWTLLDRRGAIDEASRRDHAIAFAVSRLEDALATTYVADSTGQAGLQGTHDALTVRGRGVYLTQTRPEAVTESGGSELRFEPGAGALSGRSLGVPGSVLERLSAGFEVVRFRYHDGVAWRETFDSAAEKKLPVAVEVSFWLGSASPAAEPVDGLVPEPPEPGEPPLRPADRTRIIVVPDGPATAWKEGA
jgi:hypothetical protein